MGNITQNKDLELFQKELKNYTINQLNNYPYSNKKAHFINMLKAAIRGRKVNKIDPFFWPNGILATSLEWSHRLSGSNEEIQQLINYYGSWYSQGMTLYYLDNTLNGYSLIYLYQVTKDERYFAMIERMIEYLFSHTELSNGSLPYRETNNNNVLIDSIGMICPFLTRYGSLTGNNKSMDLAIKQINNFMSYGLDKDTNLPYHGFDHSTGQKLGIIGWGRGLGWLLIGVIDSIEYLPKNHPEYDEICILTKKMVEVVVNYQKSNGAFSWQITAHDGLDDSSATSMICYAIRRGVMLKILPESYLKYTSLAISSLYNSTNNGIVQNCSAECGGLGIYPQRYANYPWGQGPTTSLVSIAMMEKDEIMTL